jgi:hypothetical protein
VEGGGKEEGDDDSPLVAFCRQPGGDFLKVGLGEIEESSSGGRTAAIADSIHQLRQGRGYASVPAAVSEPDDRKVRGAQAHLWLCAERRVTDVS